MVAIRRSHLDAAVREGILSVAQADRLVAHFGNGADDGAPRRTALHAEVRAQLAASLRRVLPDPLRELIDVRTAG